jgi:hypothetical protein
MAAEGPQDVSGLLVAWSKGDEEALSDLVPLVYPELRRIARQHLRRRSPDHTLQSAALVSEAYLKLIRARGIRCDNRVHFYALCANDTAYSRGPCAQSSVRQARRWACASPVK